MIKKIRQEMKNCKSGLTYKIMFWFMWLMSISGFAITCVLNFGKKYQHIRSASDQFILNSTSARAIAVLIAALLPLISIAIYSTSRMDEEQSGIAVFICLRQSAKSYIYIKAIVISIVTFSVIFIPLIANQLLCIIAFPIEGYDNLWGQPNFNLLRWIDKNGSLNNVRISYPYFANILESLILGLMGAAMSLCAYGLTFIRKMKKMKNIQFIILVFIGFVISSLMFQLFQLKFLDYLSLTQNSGTILEAVIFIAILLILSVFLIHKGAKKYEEMVSI